MKRDDLSGVFAPMVTPFGADDAVLPQSGEDISEALAGAIGRAIRIEIVRSLGKAGEQRAFELLHVGP